MGITTKIGAGLLVWHYNFCRKLLEAVKKNEGYYCMMPYRLMILTILSFFLINGVSNATPPATTRIAQFSNNKISVWETIIYPSANQKLKMHRHEHDRVVVALTDGVLKITNDKGKVHYLKLQKNKAYYLTKDIPNELHNDENMSSHPIKVLVIELQF
ncbi:MAG: uncharacterized protein K0S27_1389 [Gammaproteobacteria bacterium]|jgi:hypothetical protein|nr:uncharacterized protein [Gammaproteobacteria bacterium]